MTYNPNQPRLPAGDRYGGRWTSTGTGGGPANQNIKGVQLASTATAIVARELAPFAPAMIGPLMRMLGQLGLHRVGLTGVLGALLIPTNDSHITEGVIPGQPDLIYRLDEGFLTIWRNVPGDEKPLIFHGPPGPDGLYRLPDGTIIGRDLGNGILLNQAAIAREKQRLKTRAQSTVRAKDEVKLCPDPGPDRPSTQTMSLRAIFYQSQITGLLPGEAVVLNGIFFDGCRTIDGVMLEAKGEGFAWALQEDGEFFENYNGKVRIIEQMQNQSLAAGQRLVEWHFAEKEVAAYFARFVAQEQSSGRLLNIQIRHTPPILEGETQ